MSKNMRLIQKVIAIVMLVVCIGTEAAAQLSLNPPQAKVSYGGHEWVDLGLSVKWASCNVGASSESDYGDYFAWGEIAPKSSYTADNSKTYKRNMGDISGDIRYDVARAKWGHPWRLPNIKEMKELKEECDWQWVTQGGHNGYKVTSKKTGDSIFLPAAGNRRGELLEDRGKWGLYWSCIPDYQNAEYAYVISFYAIRYGVNLYSRFCGYSVRPVCD